MSHSIEQIAINTIRTLSIDAIDKANSGHPGLPLGAAPMAYVLWTKHLQHNPKNPQWANRDRFVLSAGHGSMLLYSLLHLSGYDLSLDDLKSFRQYNSKTPGHPEYGWTPGVEATTGPLGQGIGMGVGMAMAERHLSSIYNEASDGIVDHFTYVLCGDGDLMEGISHEAASLAGHLRLGKLIVLYDSNDISLDGDLSMSFSENIKGRFESYGWHYLRVQDGNNLEEIDQALSKAKTQLDRPTIIEVKTIIGYGSPNMAGTSDVHGAPLGKDETTLTKQSLGWTYPEAFTVPNEVKEHFMKVTVERGKKEEDKWNQKFDAYRKKNPERAKQFEDSLQGKLPDGWDSDFPSFEVGKSIASRSSSGEVLNAIAKKVPYFFGGSADLAGSNKTEIKGAGDFLPFTPQGRNIWFGVREFAMGAALNGMALHGGLKVFGGTFFVFSDYLRPSIRLAALMEIPVTYVFTHDSIAVGEDGPTHEPVEQLAALRAMPHLHVIRPADANETKVAWKIAVESTNQPTALVLTRQNLPTLQETSEKAEEGVRKGGYVIRKSSKMNPDGLLLASGSEVSRALKVQEQLLKDGIDVSVISLPSWDIFEKQSETYRNEVFPPSILNRVAIEMGASLGWHKYVGSYGEVIGIDRFGGSAPGDQLMKEYGFHVDAIVARVKNRFSK